MAVLAEYHSGNEAYARSANAAIQGLDAGQSLMERKQSMRIQQQRADNQQYEFEAKKPVIVANAMADVASAQASIANATQMEVLRAKAAKDSSTYNGEFLQALQYDSRFDVPASDGTPEGDNTQADQGEYATQETLDTRSQKLSALSSKIGWMKLVPEYKGFVDTVEKETIAAHLSAAQNRKLDELQKDAQLRADQARYGVDSRVTQAQILADSRQSVATGNQASHERIADTAAQARRDAATNRANKTYEFEVSVQKRDEAQTAGDLELAQLYQNRINKINSSPTSVDSPLPATAKPRPVVDTPPLAVSVDIPNSGFAASNGGVSRVAPESQPAAADQPAAVTPKRVDPKASTVEIGGKNYPIFKDKNGKRAYKVDGHYVPIDTQ